MWQYCLKEMCIDCGLVNWDEIIDDKTNLLSHFQTTLQLKLISHTLELYNQRNSNSREISINSTLLQLTKSHYSKVSNDLKL